MKNFEQRMQKYACVWLDVYGRATPESIGLAVPKKNESAFVFRDGHGGVSFTNIFIYDPATNAREDRFDNVTTGTAKPFARFKLPRE